MTTIPIDYLPGLLLATINGGVDTVSGYTGCASPSGSVKYLMIPMDTLSGLSDAEAKPDDGDIRKIIFELETLLYTSYQTQLALAANPAQWVNARSSSLDDSTGIINRNFVNQFFTITTGEDVADEPM